MNNNESTKLTASEIDALIQRANGSADALDEATVAQVMILLDKLKIVKASGDDERRELWLHAQRGSIDDFGSYEEYCEEGEVESREEFQELWEHYYPDPLIWYEITTITYKNIHSVFCGDKLIFRIYPEPQHPYVVDNLKLAVWLTDAVDGAVQSLEKGTYNKFVDDNLPYRKRIGKIFREDYWNIFPEEKEAYLKDISLAEIQAFVKTMNIQPEKEPTMRLPQMTSGFFFNCCKLGYAANRYKDADALTAKQLYIANADGRDDGLLELDEDSADEFSEWYHNRAYRGGHPWEVCRGGNSTHISLCVYHDEHGWYLSLVGSSYGRSVETIKFYMALVKQGIPISLRDGAGLAAMITGTDYIGIVPEGIFPVYCSSLFPDEKMLGFMNLLSEEIDKLIAAAKWYPLPQVRTI